MRNVVVFNAETDEFITGWALNSLGQLNTFINDENAI